MDHLKIVKLMYDECFREGQSQKASIQKEVSFPILPASYGQMKKIIAQELPKNLKFGFTLKTENMRPLGEHLDQGNFRENLITFIRDKPKIIVDFGTEMDFDAEKISIVPDSNLKEALITNLSGRVALTELIENSIEALAKSNATEPKIEVHLTSDKELHVDDNGCGVDVEQMQNVPKLGVTLNNRKIKGKEKGERRGEGGGFMYLCAQISIHGIGTIATKAIGQKIMLESMTEGSDVLAIGEIDWEQGWDMELDKKKILPSTRDKDKRKRKKDSFLNITIKNLTKKFLGEYTTKDKQRELRQALSEHYYFYLKGIIEYGLPKRPPSLKPIEIKLQGSKVQPMNGENSIEQILEEAQKVKAPTWRFPIEVTAVLELSQGSRRSCKTIKKDSAVINCVAYYFPCKNGIETAPVRPVRKSETETETEIESETETDTQEPLSNRAIGVKVFWVGKYIPDVNVSIGNQANLFEFMKPKQGKPQQEMTNRVVVFAFFPGSFQLNDHKTNFSTMDPKFDALRNPESNEFMKKTFEQLRKEYTKKIEGWSKKFDEKIMPWKEGKESIHDWTQKKLTEVEKEELCLESDYILVFEGSMMKIGKQFIDQGDAILLKQKRRNILADFDYLFISASSFVTDRNLSSLLIMYNEWGLCEGSKNWCSVSQLIGYGESVSQFVNPQLYAMGTGFPKKGKDGLIKPMTVPHSVRFALKAKEILKYIKFNVLVQTEFLAQGSNGKPKLTENRITEKECDPGKTLPQLFRFYDVGIYSITATYLSPYPSKMDQKQLLAEVIISPGKVAGFKLAWKSTQEEIYIPADGTGKIPEFCIQFHDANSFPVADIGENIIHSLSVSEKGKDHSLIRGRILLNEDGTVTCTQWKFKKTNIHTPRKTALIVGICTHEYESLGNQELEVFLTSGILTHADGIVISDDVDLDMLYSLGAPIPPFAVTLTDKAGNCLMASPLCPDLSVFLRGDIEGSEKKLKVVEDENGVWRVEKTPSVHTKRQIVGTANIQIVVVQGDIEVRKEVHIRFRDYKMAVSFMCEDLSIDSISEDTTILCKNNKQGLITVTIADGEDEDDMNTATLLAEDVQLVKDNKDAVHLHSIENNNRAKFILDLVCLPQNFYKPTPFQVSFLNKKVNFKLVLSPGPNQILLKDIHGKDEIEYQFGTSAAFHLYLYDSEDKMIYSPSCPLTSKDLEIDCMGLPKDSVDTKRLRVASTKQGYYKVSKFIISQNLAEHIRIGDNMLLVKAKFLQDQTTLESSIRIHLLTEVSKSKHPLKICQSEVQPKKLNFRPSEHKITHSKSCPEEPYQIISSNRIAPFKQISNQDKILFHKANFYVASESGAQVACQSAQALMVDVLYVCEGAPEFLLHFDAQGETTHSKPEIPHFKVASIPQLKADGSISTLDLAIKPFQAKKCVKFIIKLRCTIANSEYVSVVHSKDFPFLFSSSQLSTINSSEDSEAQLQYHYENTKGILDEYESLKEQQNHVSMDNGNRIFSLLNTLKTTFQEEESFQGILCELCAPVIEASDAPGIPQLLSWKKGLEALSIVLRMSEGSTRFLNQLQDVFGSESEWENVRFMILPECGQALAEHSDISDQVEGFIGYAADFLKPLHEQNYDMIQALLKKTMIFHSLDQALKFQMSDFSNSEDIWCLDGGSISRGAIVSTATGIPSSDLVFGQSVAQGGLYDSSRLKSVKDQLSKAHHDLCVMIRKFENDINKKGCLTFSKAKRILVKIGMLINEGEVAETNTSNMPGETLVIDDFLNSDEDDQSVSIQGGNKNAPIDCGGTDSEEDSDDQKRKRPRSDVLTKENTKKVCKGISSWL